MDRRLFVLGGLAAVSRPLVKLTSVELLPVRATARTVWLIIRLRSDAGIDGLGEASEAFGISGTTAENVTAMRVELARQFELLRGRSPFDVEHFRLSVKLDGLLARTVHSALEQAMWDLAGRVLDVPVYSLLGGKIRERLRVYANINRATTPRTP